MKKLILAIVFVVLSVGVVEASDIVEESDIIETEEMREEATRASIEFVTNNRSNLLLWSMVMVLNRDGDEQFIRESIMEDVELFMSKKYDTTILDRDSGIYDAIYHKIMTACHFFACGQQQGFNTMIVIDNNIKASLIEGVPGLYNQFIRAQLERENAH
ncbi:MAG: hypothetical protein GY777_15810 [Candidatus Brocadiaceae bacterium]|nr:hypothetical protein [Candidatus Brocadiaceae bacterium]